MKGAITDGVTALPPVLKRIPGLRPTAHALKGVALALRLARSPFIRTYPPGDFYSPLPDRAEIPSEIPPRRDIPGVDLREEQQLALLEQLGTLAADLPFHEEASAALRYWFGNEWFSYCDATVLHTMLRHFRPRRVVEVGSGFSSAVMLDTRDLFLERTTHYTFIDPYPQRLQSLLRPNDQGRCDVLPVKVQQVPMSVFEALSKDDILFVDSSHVVKVGSDVAWIVFEILPRLASGVVVHFHDIPWPFEYPTSWFRAGRAWNEAYFLRALLQDSERFEILFFNDFMKTHHRQALARHLPTAVKDSAFPLTRAASSLWIVKR
jgi:hypothetical protein